MRGVNPLISQNGQTHFKNLAAFSARFLKCVWPFYDIAKQKVKKWPALRFEFEFVIESLKNDQLVIRIEVVIFLKRNIIVNKSGRDPPDV